MSPIDMQQAYFVPEGDIEMELFAKKLALKKLRRKESFLRFEHTANDSTANGSSALPSNAATAEARKKKTERRGTFDFVPRTVASEARYDYLTLSFDVSLRLIVIIDSPIDSVLYFLLLGSQLWLSFRSVLTPLSSLVFSPTAVLPLWFLLLLFSLLSFAKSLGFPSRFDIFRLCLLLVCSVLFSSFVVVCFINRSVAYNFSQTCRKQAGI